MAVMFASWIVLATAVAVVYSAVPRSSGWLGLSTAASLAVPWLALIGWPWYFARRFGSGPGAEFGWSIRWSDVGLGLLGGAATLVVGSVIGAITRHFYGPFNSSAGDVAAPLHGQRFWLAFFAMLVAFGAPVAEEFAFRGVLFAAFLRRGMSPVVTNLLVALVFALIHFEPIRFPLLFGIGLVLGYLRQRTGRVGAGIVAHATNNVVGAWSLLSM